MPDLMAGCQRANLGVAATRKAKNRHWAKRHGKPGPTASGKTIVAGAVRKGNVRTSPLSMPSINTSSALSTPQTIEGFGSIFKRGIVVSFHKVSAKHMLLYVAEFQFRYNIRLNEDIFGTAIEGC
jgi:hypothetical protein